MLKGLKDDFLSDSEEGGSEWGGGGVHLPVVGKSHLISKNAC